MSTTTSKGIEKPSLDGSDTNDAPYYIGKVADWLNANPGVASHTTAERNALVGIDIWQGRIIVNADTGLLEVNDGTAGAAHWHPLALTSYVDASINTEATRATAAEGSLAGAINTEATRATAAEGSLSTRINTEATRATAAEGSLGGAIGSETSRATAAEGTLAAAIANEITRAQAVEGALGAGARFTGNEPAPLAGAAPGNGTVKITRQGSVIVSVVNGSGGFAFGFHDAFANGVVSVLISPGDNASGLASVVPLASNYTLHGGSGVAHQASGAAVPNGANIRVNYIAVGW
ncbi:hypothetical protein Back2_18010 [Nocardioides baekrokdamisoli]|uniref:Tail fiber protein n=1 Tax=Nocardioides baekrokdamisoli TaxID=1804624 RepID=A0A3G9J237_9ACTN|nr:hypothetical protein [Nocardioides baekrokdamisoli]BBH17514.1 hypothetical protein Back2_18010 [Nocardioides baekrokdamisoli]